MYLQFFAASLAFGQIIDPIRGLWELRSRIELLVFPHRKSLGPKPSPATTTRRPSGVSGG
jgi:hypothetical protein